MWMFSYNVELLCRYSGGWKLELLIYIYIYIYIYAAKSLQSCLTLWDPIDCNPPGSATPGILQARTLEWVAISSCNAWKWKVSEVAQSCQTLSDPMDCSLPGSSVHGIFQARVLEWGAIAFSIYIYIYIYICVCVCVIFFTIYPLPAGKLKSFRLFR